MLRESESQSHCLFLHVETNRRVKKILLRFLISPELCNNEEGGGQSWEEKTFPKFQIDDRHSNKAEKSIEKPLRNSVSVLNSKFWRKPCWIPYHGAKKTPFLLSKKWSPWQPEKGEERDKEKGHEIPEIGNQKCKFSIFETWVPIWES